MVDPAIPQNQWGNWQLQFGIPVQQARYDLYKIGQIIKVLKQPCHPSPKVYVETLGPVVLNALVSLAEPDAKELYKWGHEGQPKGKNGRSLGKHVKTIVGAIEQIAPQADDGLGHYLFDFLKFADEASFYVWFASIVADGVYEWLSMAWKKAGCTDAPQNLWTAPTPEGPVGSIQAGQVSAIIWNGTQNGVPNVFPSVVTIPANATWSAGCTIQATPYIAQPNVNYRIVCKNVTTNQIVHQSDFMSSDNSGNKMPISFGNQQPAVNFEQEIVVGLSTDINFDWDYVPQQGYLNLNWQTF